MTIVVFCFALHSLFFIFIEFRRSNSRAKTSNESQIERPAVCRFINYSYFSIFNINDDVVVAYTFVNLQHVSFYLAFLLFVAFFVLRVVISSSDRNRFDFIKQSIIKMLCRTACIEFHCFRQCLSSIDRDISFSVVFWRYRSLVQRLLPR